MPPTLADRVRHILEAITNIERVLAGKTEQDFAADCFLRLLVERRNEPLSGQVEPVHEDLNHAHRVLPPYPMPPSRRRHAR